MKYNITKEHVKLLGRTFFYKEDCWCGLSGSGIAFTFTGTQASVTFVGDDTTRGFATEGQARVGIYVNGVRFVDRMMEQPEETITIYESSKTQTINVEIIKLSECPMSLVGIRSIQCESIDGIHPLPARERKIEFIGDSITCGYGVDMEDPQTLFETRNEDVTKAYAYRVAKKLNADYSMVSYSGYGLISGYTDDDEPKKEQLVSTYYDKVGFSYAHPAEGICMEQQQWDFTQYQPQLVVVNLGTNDDSYCKDDSQRQQSFTDAYVAFLQQIRHHNPEASILCTVGLMGQRIYPAVEAAVHRYIEETGESDVAVLQLPEQLPEDGLVSSGHPTVISHEKTAKLIAERASRACIHLCRQLTQRSSFAITIEDYRK